MEAICYEVPRRHLYQLSPFGTRQYQQKHKYKMQDLDILNDLNSIDLSKVETAFPILKTGIVSATITGCEVTKDPNKPDAKPYVLVKYSLAAPWETVSIDGAPTKAVNPGFPFNERIYFGNYQDKTTGETKQYGVDRIAKLREAVFGKAAPGTKFAPEELVGQSITVKLKFDPAPKNSKTGETYGPQTTVDGYMRKAAS